jgi:hypothetical protein
MFERVWQFFASLCDLRGHRPRNPSAPEELPEKGRDGRTPFAPRCLKDAVEERLFAHRRDLLTRLDLVFMDTTSLYFKGAGGQTLGRHGYSKDHRPDLRQVILAALIDGDGRPVPGLRPGDVAGRHRDRPAAPALRHRAGVCVVADRGMISADGAGERHRRGSSGTRRPNDAFSRSLGFRSSSSHRIGRIIGVNKPGVESARERVTGQNHALRPLDRRIGFGFIRGGRAGLCV